MIPSLRLGLALFFLGAIATAAPTPSGPLIPDTLWETLAAPSEKDLDALSARLPGLDRRQLKEIPPETTLQLLSTAVDRGLSALDLFTDAALRQDRLYYIPERTLAQLDEVFELSSLFPIRGTTTDKRLFAVQALVMGRGKIEMLYNFDGFVFRHPLFRDFGGKYVFRGQITQTIEDQGSVSISGAKGPMGVTIKKFIKLSATRVKVITSFTSPESELIPITRRLGPLSH